MKKARKTPRPCPPDWLHELELPIQRVIFHYELVRRTPAGRAKNWPQWNEVKPQIRLALRRALTIKPRSPIAFEPTVGYHALTHRHPWAGGDPEGRPVYFDLEQPIDILKDYFEQVILNLRTEQGIGEIPKELRETQPVAWNWIGPVTSKNPFNIGGRSKRLALARGKSFVEAVARCFEDPVKVIREFRNEETPER